MAKAWQVTGTVDAAPFTLKLHRGEGMCLLAMDWKNGQPPADFVGFAIEYSTPKGEGPFQVKNRIAFPGRSIAASDGKPAEQYPSKDAPFQMFRWVHFPRGADRPGLFTYRVTPMFMDAAGTLSAKDAQEAQISLYEETIPGKLNVAFTRGYVSSQAFVDKFGGQAGFATLIPADADAGPGFKPTHADAKTAYAWMGFEARQRIIETLTAARDDGAEVMIVAYELNLPELITLLTEIAGKIGPKLRVILDNSSNLRTDKKTGKVSGKDKGDPSAAESQAAATLKAAGAQIVRQCMGGLQHNKMIVVDGPTVKRVVFGSTNFSWRGFYVQSNNAVIVTGKDIVDQQRAAFEAYWGGNAKSFAASDSAAWLPLHVDGVDAQVAMSPHNAKRSTQQGIADDIETAVSSVFYSLAFLNQTTGPVTDAVLRASKRPDLFAYGIANAGVKGLAVMQPNGNPAIVSPASLTKGVPEPFRSEATGGGGIRMHHKFVVIDFDQPNARVYTGSYNFSKPADMDNGENLLVIRSEEVATSYMVEALRIFDAYQFRLAAQDHASGKAPPKTLVPPPSAAGEKPWFDKFYTEPTKIRDRELFA